MTPLKSDSSKKMDVEEESCHQGRLRGCLITPERHVAPESGYVMDAAKERERERLQRGVHWWRRRGRQRRRRRLRLSAPLHSLRFANFSLANLSSGSGVALTARLSQNSSSIVLATSFFGLPTEGEKGKDEFFSNS